MKPAPNPRISELSVRAIAKFNPMNPEIRTNVSGLISGDETRKAMTGAQGKAVVSNEMTTAIVPQAQSGVRAPKAILPRIIKRLFFRNSLRSFIESTYTVIITAIKILRKRYKPSA
jgi:hypothetical protein